LSFKTLDEIELEYIGWDSFFNFNQALLAFLLRKSLHTDSIDWWNCFDLIENLIDLTLPHIFLYSRSKFKNSSRFSRLGPKEKFLISLNATWTI